MSDKAVLVTGGTGFIGSRVLSRLQTDARYSIRAATRRSDSHFPPRVSAVRVEDLSGTTKWDSALAGVGTVVHLAARVHVMRETAKDSVAAFRAVNVEGTLSLARRARDFGAKRFVFLSSAKVNGDMSSSPFRECDPPAPGDPYAVSKYEAEIGLREIAAATGLEVVIIRPPLVYGPGVKGNFLALMRVVARGIPLPLGAVDNRRSLVALDNLVDFIVACVDHPSAADHTFLVSDGEDVSTADLIRRVARMMKRPVRLIPIPAGLLSGGAALLGMRAVAQRLLGSLQVDISKARNLLRWVPPATLDDGLRQAVSYFYASSEARRL